VARCHSGGPLRRCVTRIGQILNNPPSKLLARVPEVANTTHTNSAKKHCHVPRHGASTLGGCVVWPVNQTRMQQRWVSLMGPTTCSAELGELPSV